MLQALCLLIMLTASIALQAAFVPAFLPRVLQPDVFLPIGIAALSFGSREFGLTALFALGFCADLIGQGRFGLTPFCYLLAAAAIMPPAKREQSRGDLGAAWLAAVVCTVLAHSLHILIGKVFGAPVEWGLAFGGVLSRAIAACLWGLPAVYLTGSLMFRLRIMSPQVLNRWVSDERMAEARKRRAA